MATVNRELVSTSGQAQDPAEFAAGVGRLFGQSPRVLVNAVQRFLSRTPVPGSLDHHLLRIIAAAAPHIDDPQLVAEMVDGLPVTGMSLSAHRLDLEWAGEILGRALPRYRPRTRQRLVADLVNRSVRDVVLASPADRLTPEARELAVGYLEELARGRPGDTRAAVESPHATPAVIAIALGTTESRIVKAEQQAARGDGELVHLGTVGVALSSIIASKNRASSGQDAIRAFRLALRCKPVTLSMIHILDSAVRNDAVVAAEGSRLLDAIGALPDEKLARDLRGVLASSSSLDEECAHRAVREGFDYDHSPNPRVLALRAHAYAKHKEFDPSTVPSFESATIDRKIARLPLRMLPWQAIREMEDASSLQALAQRVGGMKTAQVRLLLLNCNLDLTTARDAMETHASKMKNSEEANAMRTTLVERDDMTDRSMAELTTHAPVGRLRSLLVTEAIAHPEMGIEVARLAMKERSRGPFTLRMAMNSKLHQVHEIAFEYASSRGNVDILRALWRNATLDRDLASRVEETFSSWFGVRSEPSDDFDIQPRDDAGRADWLDDDIDILDVDIDPPPGQPQYRTVDLSELSMETSGVGYEPADLVDMVINGSARPGVIEALIQSSRQDSAAARDALLALADANELDVDHWIALTAAPHAASALSYATHPNCPVIGNSFMLAAERLLSDTEYGFRLGVGEFPSDSKARSWSALPNKADQVLPRHVYASILDGQIVDGEPLVTPKSQRDLDNIADVMGNCLRDYEPKLRSRQSLVAWSHHGSRTFAVAWNIVGKTVSVEQIDAEYNSGGVPESFIEGIRDLTDKFNRGELRRVEKQVEVSNDVSRDVQSEDPPTRRVRPGRRDPLRLASSAEEQRDLGHDQTPPPPSLLAGRSGENDLATNGVEDVADAHDVQQEQVPGPTNVERDHGVDI